MALLTKTYRRKPVDRYMVVLIITIVLSVILGILAGIEFGDLPYHLCHDDMISPRWIVGGLTSSLSLCLSGIISGLVKRFR